MDLQRLRYFLEVARQKNFSKAAKVCRVSQPSLSQQIKKLESEVGGALFIRNRGSVQLSELGEGFLGHAQAVLAEVLAAEEFVDRCQSETQRTIRFGAIPTIAPYLIPEIFRKIQSKHSSARFELIENRTEVIIDALLTNEIDFALLSPPTRIDDLCERLALAKDDFLLTLPAGHRLTKSPTVSVAQLRAEKIILLENSHCLAQQTSAYCEEIGLRPAVTLHSSQIDTLLGMVEAGFGLTFTPRIAANSHHHRRVVFRQLTDNRCSRTLELVWLRRQFLTQAQRSIIECMRSDPKIDRSLNFKISPLQILPLRHT